MHRFYKWESNRKEIKATIITIASYINVLRFFAGLYKHSYTSFAYMHIQPKTEINKRVNLKTTFLKLNWKKKTHKAVLFLQNSVRLVALYC